MALRYSTKVLPMQAEVLGFTGQAAALRGAVRSGKTYALQNWMHDRMERYPKGRHAVMGANLPQLKGGALRDFCMMMEKYGIQYKYRSTDGHIELVHNGAELHALSADVGQRILSHSYDTLWLEEPQTWNNAEETYYSLMTRLSGSAEGQQRYPDMEPQMRLSFNPRQTFIGHWLWHLIAEKKALPEFVFRTRDNFLMRYNPNGIAGYVEFVKSQLPEELWRVELDGEWATSGAGVYRYYRRELHNEAPAGLPPYGFDGSRPLLWTLDFNVGLMCSVVAQMHTQRAIVEYDGGQPRSRLPMPGWQEQIIYVLDEIRLEDTDTPKVAEEFIRRWGEQAKRVGVWLYGDASGTGRSSTSNSTLSGRSNWHAIVDALDRAGIDWRWRVQRTNPPVVDRVNNTNLCFWSADGPGLVIGDGYAPFTVQDLQSVQWVEGKFEIDKKTDPKLTHLSDALGYLCWFTRMARNGSVALRDLEGINLMGR